MPTIDAHQHFWLYQPQKQEWIDDAMAVIKKDFLPQDLAPVLMQNNIDGCIAVQADQTETETNFLIDLANQHNFIKGVVGWVNLCEINIEDRLAHYKQFNIVKGFRHVLQVEEPEFMLQPNFLNGIAALQQHSFTYDILILPNHLQAAIKLVQQNPNQQFVVDHIAKPYIKAGIINEWKKDIALLAKFENVHCKISGMVTEADYQLWKPADFSPYLDLVVHAFGTNRIMYGSDWPVCLVAASYKNMLAIVKNYFSSFTLNEQHDFFANNAVKFYKL